MKNYDEISCGVLVIGGGIGGLSCAVAVKEALPDLDVLVVENNFAGYSGKANRGGGVLQYFDPKKVDPMGFAYFHTKNIGGDFTDQELMAKYVAMNPSMIERLDSWGVKMPRDEKGDYNKMQTGPMTEMICIDLDVTLNVRRRAEKLGVRFMDKTAMTELLTKDGSACGAVVMSVLDGGFTAIKAGTVVLATGSQDYRIGSMWSSGRGDGIAAAYRAGAELRNTEFGNFAQLVRVRSHNEVVFGENYMYNAEGEYLTPHFQAHRETD
ncbi:MAG: FAD-binding protein, partial [Firmicutes bacterium]|nr:FAD-binding protein [Bacillota bacterium]